MLLREIITERQVWARSGKKVVRKYRCSSGSRKGRTVASAAQCFKAPQKREQFLKEQRQD